MGRGITPSSMKGALMQNITIGRYKNAVPDDIPRPAVGIPEVQGRSAFVEDVYDGWIEGVRDDGTTWIMWLDAKGNPTTFYPRREQDGGVIGNPVDLTADID